MIVNTFDTWLCCLLLEYVTWTVICLFNYFLTVITIFADFEHRISLLCYIKLHFILLHGTVRIVQIFFLISFAYLYYFLLLYIHYIKLFLHSGLLLGRIHLYHQSHTNACSSLHRDWSLFISAVYCVCSACKYILSLTWMVKIECCCSRSKLKGIMYFWNFVTS